MRTIFSIPAIRSLKLHAVIILITGLLFGCKEADVEIPEKESWFVTVIAGDERGFLDGNVTEAQFNFPAGLALSEDGEIYVADSYNRRIRKINPDGSVITVAGERYDHVDGPVDSAQFTEPWGLFIHPDKSIYITDMSGGIRVLSNGYVRTLAGGIGGNADGTGLEAGFSGPSGITLGKDGNLYIADQYNNVIRKVTLEGVVTTLAGSLETTHGHKDGYRTNALFFLPTDICPGPDGSLYVTDLENRRIRKIDPAGFVSTIAGNDCTYYCDYDGIGIEAQFSNPTGIARAEDGTLYIADGTKVRKMTPDGQVRTIAGRRDPGKAEGYAAQFWTLMDIVIAPDGSLIVSDHGNHRICKITREN